MESRSAAALFLSLNILFFALATANHNQPCNCSRCYCNPGSHPRPGSNPRPTPTPGNPGTPGTPRTPRTPGTPTIPRTPGTPISPGTPGTPTTPTTPGTPGTPTTPTTPGTPGTPTTPTTPGTPTTSNGSCPIDALKLGICANVLGLVNVTIGSPPTLPCCSLLQGLVDLEAAVCLCTAIRGNILGINLNLPISLSLVLNNCGRNAPNGFQCTN